jgi:hypothetical protein
LTAWLEEDYKRPKSQRCSAQRLHERLQEVGYAGAYDSVQRFVKQWQLTEKKDSTIMEIFEQDERAALRPMLPLFEGYSQRCCKVSSTCLVTFDRNR